MEVADKPKWEGVASLCGHHQRTKNYWSLNIAAGPQEIDPAIVGHLATGTAKIVAIPKQQEICTMLHPSEDYKARATW